MEKFLCRERIEEKRTDRRGRISEFGVCIVLELALRKDVNFLN